MSKIVVQAFLTLDGVVQAPGALDEDPSGGFPHGGWQQPVSDETLDEVVARWMSTGEALLLGRRTYEIFANFWPKIGPEHEYAEVAAQLNNPVKYVASRTLDRVDWHNSTLLGDDVPGAVAKLRDQPGGEIHVHGSANLIQTLLKHDLVDEFRLVINPVVLGTGKRLFAEGTRPATFEMAESSVGEKAIYVVYRRAGEVTYGTF